MAKTKTAVATKQMFQVEVSPDFSKYMGGETFTVEAGNAEEAAQKGAKLARAEYQSAMKYLASKANGTGRIGQAEIAVRKHVEEVPDPSKNAWENLRTPKTGDDDDAQEFNYNI